MNLDSCTPGQRQAIETLDKPLMIVAGAGSGKTFTLTQRIVGALLPQDDPSSKPFLDDIGQVLAITFTKKAAAELRDRVKEALFAEGLDEQALATNDAWISTIHGMAARILRENALELGLDPAFEVIEGGLESQLKDQAVSGVVASVRRGEQPGLESLLSSYSVRGFAGRSGLADLAFQVISRVRAMPTGFGGLVVPHPPKSPRELMLGMVDLGRAFQDTAATWEKTSKQDEDNLNRLTDALEAAREWLEHDEGIGFESDEFDAEAFCEAFYAFPPTSPKYRAKADDAVFFERWRQAYASAAQDALTGLSHRQTVQLVHFAQLLERHYADLKGPARLDNDDLLNKLVRALSDHPEIQAWYRNKFKLIMIDEFQDTDRLQLSAIEALAAPDLHNLATVGDAQQSIYRFRGADVNVFLDFAKRLRDLADPCFVELPDNFRSHRAVLSFVQRIFEQPAGFGKDFLNLQPKGKVNDEPDPLFDDASRPRIQVSDIRAETSIGDARLQAAADVAEHFSQLRADGAKASEMVVLLGAMSNAGLYLDALHQRGFDAVVSGGSVFAQQPDVQMVASALRLAANPRFDTLALYEVLAGEWFNLSDDVLLWLCRSESSEGGPCAQSLSSGFFGSSACEARLSECNAAALAHARTTIGEFLSQMRGPNKRQALLDLALHSGRLARLEALGADGQAAAASLLKAAAVAGRLARTCTGPSQLANEFSHYLDSSKEAPGTLSANDADFVRIMTIHASKGLEFPHVAVSELRESASAASLLAENAGEHTYVFLKRSFSDLPGKKVADALKGFSDSLQPSLANAPEVGASDPACTDCAASCDLDPSAPDLPKRIERFRAEQERQEGLRLLYVALTRASKSLFVCNASSGKTPKHAPGRASGLLRDALDWDVEASGSVQLLDFGSDAPASVTVAVLEKPANHAPGVHETPERHGSDDRESPASQDAGTISQDARKGPDADGADGGKAYVVPIYPEFDRSLLKVDEDVREDLIAYSSLRHATPTTQGRTETDKPNERTTTRLDPFVPLFTGNEPEDPTPHRAADEDSATALGSAFHLLCQQAIERANALGSDALHLPDDAATARQIAKQELTPHQATRLQLALERWFGSSACNDLASAPVRKAEVPFMLQLKRSDERAPVYLEGAIDALATTDDTACFYDYKTGGSAEEDLASLHEKHLLQAQCYALALLEAGYGEVRGVFVRVEQLDSNDAGQPQTVEYRFTADERPTLRQAVLRALPSRLA